MAVLPQQFFTLDNVYMRTGPPGERQTYDSVSLNRKFCGPPKGVYVGFIPSAAGSVLTLSPDGVEGHSTLKVESGVDPGGMDIVEESAITLDFATTLAAEFLPDGIQVLALASYSETVDTTGTIVTRTKTVTLTLFTVGGSPATVDLATLAVEPTVPSSLSIAVDVDGSGPDTITDDGNGVLSSAGPALPLGGTINYQTGAMTGVTAPLTAASTVDLTRTRLVLRSEVLLCTVTGTPGTIVVNTTPPFFGAPAERDVPVAAGVADLDFGFLASGGIEALAAAVEILNEVAAARIDLQSVSHPNLKTRLDTDLGAEAMGTRLGKVIRLIRSNTYAVLGGATEVNVSGSMSEINRDFLPAVTLTGSGTETVEGVVAAPVDAVRNVVFMVNSGDGDRLIDNATDREIVIGRLEQETDFLLDGVITFSNALTNVTGDASAQFSTQLQAGDTIQGADGKFYEVASIESQSALTLLDAYQGVGASSGGLLRRRFLLKFFLLSGVVEAEHALEADASIEFYIPAFLSVARANMDGTIVMHRAGERPPVPDSTTAIPGKVELASNSSVFAGSVLLQERGNPVAGGPFHTLNFTATEAVLSELAAGLVDVLGIGPVGPVGVGGGPGPQGPPGDQGLSYNAVTTMALDTEIALGPGPAQVTRTHTVDFGYTIGFLGGGISRFRDAGNFAVADNVEVDLIQKTTATTGIIRAFGNSGGFIDSFMILYLNAAGNL